MSFLSSISASYWCMYGLRNINIHRIHSLLISQHSNPKTPTIDISISSWTMFSARLTSENNGSRTPKHICTYRHYINRSHRQRRRPYSYWRCRCGANPSFSTVHVSTNDGFSGLAKANLNLNGCSHGMVVFGVVIKTTTVKIKVCV